MGDELILMKACGINMIFKMLFSFEFDCKINV